MDFKPGLEKEKFKETLKHIDYAVFDFDGTIYPGLFLFDLAKKIFEQQAGEKKTQLDNIALLYRTGNFENAYYKFVDLLKNENRESFQEITRQMMPQSYKYAGLAIKTLKEEYKIKSYLISLTSDFIANIAMEQFGFERTFSIEYKYKNGQEKRFNGEVGRIIKNPQDVKMEMLLELKKLEPESNKFICFFDSSDDLPISKSANLKIGINPKPNLIKEIDFDLILKGTPDPWKDFYDFIQI